MKKQVILLDGQYHEADSALLRRLTPGISLGVRKGAFETMLVCGGDVCFFDDHYRRLCRGLKACGIRVLWTKRELKESVQWLLTVSFIPDRSRNASRSSGVDMLSESRASLSAGAECVSARKDMRVRVMVWKERGRARWAVVPAEYERPTPAQYKNGVDILVVPIWHTFKKGDGLFKPLDYKIYRDASQRAARHGCFEALLTGRDGRIIDGSRTSLLVLTEEGMIVPPVGYGTLDGLMRRRIVRLARAAGFKILRRRVFAQDLPQAKACWLTNSLLGLIPVRQFLSPL